MPDKKALQEKAELMKSALFTSKAMVSNLKKGTSAATRDKQDEAASKIRTNFMDLTLFSIKIKFGNTIKLTTKSSMKTNRNGQHKSNSFIIREIKIFWGDVGGW